MSEKRFVVGETLFNCYQIKCEKKDYSRVLAPNTVAMLLNEQQATIEMYQRRVDKREEQISIIKKHCLKFLTDEQVETMRKELEDEIGRV